VPRREFRAFIARSLDLLEAETPHAYAELARALDGLPLALEVDAEAMLLAFERGRHALRDAAPAPVLLRTTHAAILDLVDGRTSLLAALREERLWLQGAPASLVRFDAALRAYLAGAVRSPSFLPLLADYRRRACDAHAA
jgi:hypothetical protein